MESESIFPISGTDRRKGDAPLYGLDLSYVGQRRLFITTCESKDASDADSPSLDIHGFIQASTCVTTCRWLCTYKFVSIMGTCRFLIAILLYEIVIYFKQVYRKSACVYRVPTYATMFVNLSPPTSMFSVLPVISRGDSWLMNDTARRQDY